MIVSEEAAWIPAGWVARNAAEQLLNSLAGAPPSVRERLEGIFLYPGALVDFSDASADEMQSLCQAARKTLEMIREQGAENWTQPELFSGYVRQFTALVEILSRDPRVQEEAP